MSQRFTFQLPFRGSWFVFWGGDTKKLNYHHDDAAEKYALDMVILDTAGKTHSGPGTKNQDYYAYGQDVLAPADGEIVEAVDGFRDNLPQKTTNDYAYPGNFLMIKHGEKLCSVLEHLRQGSVSVRAGQEVKVGQKLGECGNSGNSTEPHLHFHVMDNDTLRTLDKNYVRKPLAKGVKAYFEVNIQCNGATFHRHRYAPVKGDVISRV